MTMVGHGFDPGEDLRRSLEAAGHHARTSGAAGGGRVDWTPGNVLRLVVVLSVVVGMVTVGLRIGVQADQDEAASRAAVKEYFTAIERGDAVAGFVVSCDEEPLYVSEWATPEVAEALSDSSVAETDVEIGPHLDGDNGRRWHDFELPRRARGTVVLQATTDSRRWQVCGLLSDIELWVGN